MGIRTGRIKLLLISNCWECHSKFETEFHSFCSRVEELDEEKRVDSWENKVLDSREGEGIPNWCLLKDKRKRKNE